MFSLLGGGDTHTHNDFANCLLLLRHTQCCKVSISIQAQLPVCGSRALAGCAPGRTGSLQQPEPTAAAICGVLRVSPRKFAGGRGGPPPGGSKSGGEQMNGRSAATGCRIAFCCSPPHPTPNTLHCPPSTHLPNTLPPLPCRPDKDRFQRPYIHTMVTPDSSGRPQEVTLTIKQQRFTSEGFASTGEQHQQHQQR